MDCARRLSAQGRAQCVRSYTVKGLGLRFTHSFAFELGGLGSESQGYALESRLQHRMKKTLHAVSC